MSILFLFRGKAATGKTTASDLLSKKLNVPVLRKDNIYDELSKYGLEHSLNNEASYDILAKIIQTSINNDCNLIIDISLSHNPYLEKFLSKINFKKTKVLQFLCICSDNTEWRKRIEKRVDNHTPNQLFKSIEDAEIHYKKQLSFPMENEIILDSSNDISTIMKKIEIFI